MRTGPKAGLFVLRLLPALVPLAFIVAIAFTFLYESNPATYSLQFFTLPWNPPAQQGAMGFIAGTFVTSLPALFFAMLISLGVAIASAIYLPRWLTRTLDPFVDLLAGIPSVIFGLWAFIVVAPFFAHTVNPWMIQNLGFLPGFQGPANPLGLGIPVTVFILTLMIIPITTVTIRDSLRRIPRDLWESGLALGATSWEVTRRVGLPYCSRSIWSAGLLGFARAIGEAIAVSMVIGSITGAYPTSIYSETDTIAAFIATDFDQYFLEHSLLTPIAEMALFLTGVAFAANVIGRQITLRSEPGRTVG